MNEFVEECRREWKRLGVPDAVANEMAADLAADLKEADAEGVSAEEVLGSGVFDPRSFAAAWAAERGLVGQPLPNGQRLARRSRLPYTVAIAAFAILTILGVVLTIASSSGEARLALPAPFVWQKVEAGQRRIKVAPLPRPRYSSPPQQVGPPWLRIFPEPQVVVPGFSPAPLKQVIAVDAGRSDAARTVGAVLLILGVVGLLLSTLAWLWRAPGRWSPRRT